MGAVMQMWLEACLSPAALMEHFLPIPPQL